MIREMSMEWDSPRDYNSILLPFINAFIVQFSCILGALARAESVHSCVISSCIVGRPKNGLNACDDIHTYSHAVLKECTPKNVGHCISTPRACAFFVNSYLFIGI